MDINEFFDWSKIAYPNMKHRAILHNSFGIYLCEKVFGRTRTNSEGKVYSVRDIAEEHIQDDLGFIPTIQDWLEKLELSKPWMRGEKPRKIVYKRED